MQTAIQSIITCERCIWKASKFYSILASSIGDWLNEKTKTKRLGHGTYLTEVEEHELKTWAFRMQEVAFCVTLPMLKNKVREIIKKFPRVHPFKDDLLGQKWWEWFKSRHPDVVLRCGEGLEMKRSMGLIITTKPAPNSISFWALYSLPMNIKHLMCGIQTRLVYNQLEKIVP